MLAAMPVYPGVSPDLIKAENRQQDGPGIAKSVTTDLERILHSLSHSPGINGFQRCVKVAGDHQRSISRFCDQLFETVECRPLLYSGLGIDVENAQCDLLFVDGSSSRIGTTQIFRGSSGPKITL